MTWRPTWLAPAKIDIAINKTQTHVDYATKNKWNDIQKARRRARTRSTDMLAHDCATDVTPDSFESQLMSEALMSPPSLATALSGTTTVVEPGGDTTSDSGAVVESTNPCSVVTCLCLMCLRCHDLETR